MSLPLPENEPLSPVQKILLGALAALYLALLIFWVFNNQNRSLFGLGEVEGFGRMPAPVAAQGSMTWRFAPSIPQLAVTTAIAPPAVASRIERLEQVATGANGSKVFRAVFLSDSVPVYGLLGVPAQVPAPALVVCHPSDSPYRTGLHTDDTIKWLAELGIYAFAPDYRGWGPSGGQRGNEVRDVWNALATLRRDEVVKPGKVGLLGYSMGGGIAARAAAADSQVAFLGLYYAQMMGSVDELRTALRYGQFEPGSGAVQQLVRDGRAAGADDAELEYTIRMISPIYHLYDFAGRAAIFHGAEDQVVSMRQSEALAAELRRLGKPVSFQTYESLSHAFANTIENPSKGDLEKALRESLLAP